MRKILFTIALLALILVTGSAYAKTATAEIYFTKTNVSDPYDVANKITEGVYGEAVNIVGINFSKSTEVQIFLDDEYIGNKAVEDQKFTGKLTIPSSNEEKTHKVKIVGEARGETLEAEILMKLPTTVPTWVWVTIGLLFIGGIVYYIYLKMFQE